MATNDLSHSTDRRSFIGSLAAGAATTIGVSALANPFAVHAGTNEQHSSDDPEAWINKIKGKHKVVFDATRPHEIFPFAWPRVFLLTNGATGVAEKDCCAVVVLRHAAIPYAFEDRLWEKYKFGDMFKAHEPFTEKPASRNPFWKPAPGAFKLPGFGEVSIGINELQASGALFCVCSAAMTVYSAAAAQSMGKDAAEVKKDWEAGLLPGIQVVPSGVWALGRAQEKGCAYIFAG
ncbi:MAG: hypothetical protein SFU87_04940 [Chitinophagaceae bacterium]|nr:hypothetical protein [Chitinophagaceae bacterium]